MKTMNLSGIKGFCLMFLAGWFVMPSAWLAAQSSSPGAYFLSPPAAQLVRITSPANHATFYAPVDLPLFAYVHDGYDALASYASVEFYASNATGNIDLGPAVRLNAMPPAGVALPNYVWSPLTRLGAVYCRVWTNAPAGDYALRAVAGGTTLIGVFRPQTVSLSRTSAPVAISILAAPTNNNALAEVSVAAVDPVAIASTNTFWVWSGPTNAVPAWTNWPPKYGQAFTNWGPKNALFSVRRAGDVRSNLTVNYALSGTASSNVDYVGLPGTVTIPAGKAAALIPVVPLDNAATNVAKTLVLDLLPSTTAGLNYQVGVPARAEVLILDYWPRPLPWLLGDRTFHFNTNGPDGAWYYVQHSSDLRTWSTLATNQVVQGSLDFMDPDAPVKGVRFYRTIPLTNAPAH